MSKAPFSHANAQVSTADLRSHCTDTVNRVVYGHERIILNRRGKPVAAVVSMEDLERLEAMEDAEDNRVADQMERAVKSGKVKTIPLSKLKSDLGL